MRERKAKRNDESLYGYTVLYGLFTFNAHFDLLEMFSFNATTTITMFYNYELNNKMQMYE